MLGQHSLRGLSNLHLYSRRYKHNHCHHTLKIYETLLLSKTQLSPQRSLSFQPLGTFLSLFLSLSIRKSTSLLITWYWLILISWLLIPCYLQIFLWWNVLIIFVPKYKTLLNLFVCKTFFKLPLAVIIFSPKYC